MWLPLIGYLPQVCIYTIMNSKHTKNLLKLINEEIESYLLEQDPSATPPPTDPNASPADPNAAPTEATPSPEENKDDPKKKIDALAKQSDDDIRKTILAKLQNGGEKKEIEDILRYMEENKDQKDPEKSVPKNLKKVVDQLKKDFGIKTPPPEPKKPEQQPQPTTTAPATPAPVTESRTQKLVKEYLHYKKLYLRSK